MDIDMDMSLVSVWFHERARTWCGRCVQYVVADSGYSTRLPPLMDDTGSFSSRIAAQK